MKIFLGLLFVTLSLARPEIGIESSRDINAQQLTPFLNSAHLPYVTSSKAPVWVYFPDYNAYLVPAESLYPTENVIAKRTRPVASLIKLLQQRRTNKNPSDVQQSGNANTENLSNSNQKPSTTLKPPNNEPESDNTTEKEEVKPTIKPQHDKLSENKGYTFGQIFQRPENQAWPATSNRPTFQLNRPLISSYLPPGLVGWRPFSNLFQQQSETPRNHYAYNQYTTKSIPLQAQNYYFDEFSPRVPNYAEEIQDFVSHIQESVMKETSTDSDTSMMLATVPIGKNKPTSLLLRPVAKAVAGANGVAYASPVAKAVLRKGENVNIDYDPDAVAVAGPGGQAHAHPKLIVSYTNDTKRE
uniref:DUF4774 domain-containing protein n=1 Tax=Pristhesancus plagipennis TaxID=1955184 RepID=A0A2K8JMG1_PRIPG|nr:secreted hypothetical protein [Pristhesancus plagipennis]